MTNFLRFGKGGNSLLFVNIGKKEQESWTLGRGGPSDLFLVQVAEKKEGKTLQLIQKEDFGSRRGREKHKGRKRSLEVKGKEKRWGVIILVLGGWGRGKRQE